MNETLRVIKERRTTRRFKSEQIKENELQAIIEAGLYAPSASNQQSWNFTVVQNPGIISELNIETKNVGKTIPNEMVQKLSNNDKYDLFYGAPTVIIISGDSKSNIPEVDCAAATENMLIAAESLNIGGCWNGFIAMMFNGQRKEEYKKKLQIPEGYIPYYAIALGYIESRGVNAPERKANTVQYIR